MPQVVDSFMFAKKIGSSQYVSYSKIHLQEDSDDIQYVFPAGTHFPYTSTWNGTYLDNFSWICVSDYKALTLWPSYYRMYAALLPMHTEIDQSGRRSIVGCEDDYSFEGRVSVG